MKFGVREPNVSGRIAASKARYVRERRQAELVATDRAARGAQARLRVRITAVGLGKLGNAVGATSALRKRDRSGQPYGVVYARGGDQSRGGQALKAYSRGAYITARKGKWLAYSTGAVPRLVTVGGKRRRLTPELYDQSSLVATIGPLVFVQYSANRAALIVKNVSLSPKTGRAKRGTGRERSRVRVKSIVAFELIRATSRAQRFNKDSEIGQEAARVPMYMAEEMERQRSRAA